MLNNEIHTLVPYISTINVNRNQLDKKVFIDFSQNDYADTLAAPHSVRPNTLPIVSTPIDWKEVKSGLHPQLFTIQTIFKRLNKKGDLFKGVLDPDIASKNNRILDRWNKGKIKLHEINR